MIGDKNWATWKKVGAMKEDYYNQHWYVSMPPKDRVGLDSLRNAQNKQGNMQPLGAAQPVPMFEQKQDVSPGGLADDEDKNPMNQVLSDYTLIGGKEWKELRPIAMSDDVSSKDWYVKLEPS